jgi:hypothetical protein
LDKEIGACSLIAYLENGCRLKNKRKLWLYCGIGVRRRKSSGKGHRRHPARATGISRMPLWLPSARFHNAGECGRRRRDQ